MSIISPGFTIVITHQLIRIEASENGMDEFIEGIHNDEVGAYNDDKGIAPTISTWNFIKTGGI